jgi:hypothetical protein
MEQDLEQFREICLRGPWTPIRRSSQQMQITPTSIWQVVKKPLFVNPYRLQSPQAFSIKYKEIAQISLLIFFT